MFTTFVTAVYNYTLEKELRRLLFTTEEYDRFIPPDSHVRINVRVEVYTMNQLVYFPYNYTTAYGTDLSKG